jgi:hypothetical protein
MSAATLVTIHNNCPSSIELSCEREASPPAKEEKATEVAMPIFHLKGLGAVTLRKAPPKALPLAVVASAPIPALDESNPINLPEASLDFEVGEYPESKWLYWRNIAAKGFALAVQLHQTGISYHQDSLASRYEIQSGLSISLKSIAEIATGLFHRTYQIMEAGKEARILDHFCLDWEDRKLPEEKSFLELLQALHSLRIQEKRTHVHCLAGRGRSGTLVYTLALRYLSSQDPEAVLEAIRHQRMGLVETAEQKTFSLACVKKLDT